MKIIGSDYDGTLNHNGIDDEKKNAIERWRSCGNIFALISGRGPEDVLQIYNEKQFGCDYLIADNGAVIMKTDATVVSDIRCDGEIAIPLLKLLFENGCPWGEVHTSFPCRAYADKSDCKEAGEYTLQNLPEITYFNQISTMLDDFESAEKVTECVRKSFGDKLNPLQNGRCIDIVRADMNKAKGLYLLMEITGARYEDVIAVGDNINDRDMIKEFRSYAMENGVASIKALADFVTPGITEMIEKELSGHRKPEMILFDVGGTLFNDSKCIPVDGLAKLRLAAENPDITDEETMARLWDEYMEEINVGLKSKTGTKLDFPLSAPIKYVTMNTGLHFNISVAEQEEIFDRYNSERNVIDGVTELLSVIDSLGIRTAVISNNVMSGDSLSLAIKRWIPAAKMEFCLTSADLLLTKPDKSLFIAAANYAHVDPRDCWYCGDCRVPDVDGAMNSGMTPVLLDKNAELPFEMRTDGGRGEYLTINHWNVLKEYILSL